MEFLFSNLKLLLKVSDLVNISLNIPLVFAQSGLFVLKVLVLVHKRLIIFLVSLILEFPELVVIFKSSELSISLMLLEFKLVLVVYKDLAILLLHALV
jgi:hypothetical protein